MTPETTILLQLALLALGGVLTVVTALFTRRAASFDITHDFEQLVQVVARIQRATRSEVMAKVRAAGLERPAESPAAAGQVLTPKEQLRAQWRARHRS